MANANKTGGINAGKGKAKSKAKGKRPKAPKLRLGRTKAGTVQILAGALSDRQSLDLLASDASAILASDKIEDSARKAGLDRADSLISGVLGSKRFKVSTAGVKVSADDVRKARNSAIERETKRRAEATPPESEITSEERREIVQRAEQSLFRAALKTEATLVREASIRASAAQLGIEIGQAARDPDVTREALRSLRSAHKAARKASNG